jgi:hypothetical protein
LYPDSRKEETPPPSVARAAVYRGVFTVIVRPVAADFAASPPAADAGAPFAAGAGTGATAAALSFPAVSPGGEEGGAGE